MSRLITALVIGCGNRGDTYSTYALKHPDRLAIVGFADPRPHVRKLFYEKYKDTIEDDKVFTDWHEIFENDKFKNKKLSDCVIITLPDKLHKEAAIAFLENGYHILLEKPMATTIEDCREIALKCDENPNLINAVCHVLRYYAACIKLKQIIESGLIGDVVNINHTEPVGNWHFAHSFIRGNWRNESESTFSLLAKCCHDIDLLIYWMGDKKRCTSVASFGSLMHFREQNAPINAGIKCFKCPVESDCCYSSKKIYLKPNIKPNTWPYSVVLNTDGPLVLNGSNTDIEDLLQNKNDAELFEILENSLKNEKSQYDRCVYKCDNDVCDNQTVIMNFDDKSIATLTMIAHTQHQCQRKTTIYGTKGELVWDDSKSSTEISHYDFLKRKVEIIDSNMDTKYTFKNHTDDKNSSKDQLLNAELNKLKGHGGTDYILIDSFVNAVMKNDKSLILTDVKESFKSHLVVFAAELSRVKNRVVNINEDFTLSY